MRTGQTPPRLSVPVAGLTGLLALAAALAAGQLSAAFVGPAASPYLAVGDAAIDLAPGWLKDFAVRAFGTADKAVLLGGMAVVLAAVAVVTGLVSRRGALPGQLIIGFLGVLGVAAVLARSDLGSLAVAAPIASLLAGLGVFRLLHRKALTPGVSASRRAFLGTVAAAGVAGVAGVLAGAAEDADGSRAAVGPLTPARPGPPVPADADFVRLGTPDFLTPNSRFYRIDTALVVPRVRTEDWRLRVHGMVDREITYRYQDIRNRPLVERIVTLGCVSNPVGGPYLSTARFLGVDLVALLAEAGVRPGAEQLFSTSADGFTAGTPLATVLEPGRGAMLVIGMNGEPLPIEHGFPARLVVPGLYGYVSATKWVTDLEVTTWSARQAYWLKRGWAREAPVKTGSRIDAPQRMVTGGTVRVAGTAWAQHTGIDRVEVRLDDGPWRRAVLSSEITVDAWRMWWIEIGVPRGAHTVTARATDRTGATQTGRIADVVPDGATGWHTITFTAA